MGCCRRYWYGTEPPKRWQTVENSGFLQRGGLCRRVLTMPGKSSYQAMRYSGAYQLARSAEELRQLELELPGSFLAWPGELVELVTPKGTANGLWRVAERGVWTEWKRSLYQAAPG